VEITFAVCLANLAPVVPVGSIVAIQSEWCILGAPDSRLSRMGLPAAPATTAGSLPVAGPFCAIANEILPARSAATIVRLFTRDSSGDEKRRFQMGSTVWIAVSSQSRAAPGLLHVEDKPGPWHDLAFTLGSFLLSRR
jgi:hypothetical protein